MRNQIIDLAAAAAAASPGSAEQTKFQVARGEEKAEAPRARGERAGRRRSPAGRAEEPGHVQKEASQAPLGESRRG